MQSLYDCKVPCTWLISSFGCFAKKNIFLVSRIPNSYLDFSQKCSFDWYTCSIWSYVIDHDSCDIFFLSMGLAIRKVFPMGAQKASSVLLRFSPYTYITNYGSLGKKSLTSFPCGQVLSTFMNKVLQLYPLKIKPKPTILKDDLHPSCDQESNSLQVVQSKLMHRLPGQSQNLYSSTSARPGKTQKWICDGAQINCIADRVKGPTM